MEKADSLTDPFPLPYCPECGWTAPSHILPQRTWTSAWGIQRDTYMSGPFYWPSFPEFRCGCRIVHEAREKGLIDEACGGHGTGPWTMERLVGERIRQSIEELKKVVMPDLWNWGPGRLRSAREETMILDAKIEANRKLYEGRQW